MQKRALLPAPGADKHVRIVRIRERIDEQGRPAGFGGKACSRENGFPGTDGGQIWKDADIYPPSKGSATPWGIVSDARQNVYVCGQANGAGGSANWVVRKLPAGSATWTTVLKSKSDRAARGICYFPGNSKNLKDAVLAVGIFNNKWTVMRSQDRLAQVGQAQNGYVQFGLPEACVD